MSESLRAASHLPLRGMIVIEYFTLMRPINNRALTSIVTAVSPIMFTHAHQLLATAEFG